jgi:hypothetical protein
MKFRPVGAELFHADGRTDMTKLKVAFRKFANAPKNQSAEAVQGNDLRYHALIQTDDQSAQ